MNVAKGHERYLRHHRAAGSSPATLLWHRVSIAQFIAVVGEGKEVDDLAADDLRAWIIELRERGLAQDSIATKVQSVKAWGKWLAAEEYVGRDPFAKVQQPKRENKAKEIFTPEEVERLLTACNRKRAEGARDYAVMLLMFSTGLRASEVVGLCQEDVDWDARLIRVQRGKGGQFRVVPLGRAVEKSLYRYLDHPKRRAQPGTTALFLNNGGTALKRGGLQSVMRRLELRAGVHANPHKWRHSCAIQYYRNGGRAEVLQKMLGHTTMTMTLHYARLAGVDLAAAHETADPTRSLRTRV